MQNTQYNESVDYLQSLALDLQSFADLLPSELTSQLANMNSQTASEDPSSEEQNSAEIDTRSDTPVYSFYQGLQTTSQWNPESSHTQQAMNFTNPGLQRELDAPLAGTQRIGQLTSSVVPLWPPVLDQPRNRFTQTPLHYTGPSQSIQYPTSTGLAPYTAPNQTQFSGLQPHWQPDFYSLVAAAGQQEQPPTQSADPFSTAPQPPAGNVNDGRRYVCKICGYRAKRPGALEVHMRIHTGERPYSCTIPNCKRAFNVKSNYTRHLRKVHGCDGEE